MIVRTGQRARGLVGVVVGVALLAGCTATEEPEVLGVQLESPSPEEPATTPAEEPSEDASETPEEPASDAATDPASETATDAPAETETATEAPSEDVAAVVDDPPAAAAPAPAPEPEPTPDPEVIDTRVAQARLEWSTGDDGNGGVAWIDTSSQQVPSDDVAVLGAGLVPADDDGLAPTRGAACQFELTAPDGRAAHLKGELVLDLYVDGQLRKRTVIVTDVELQAGRTYVLPAELRPAAVTVALDEVGQVSCTGTFTPAG
jgi:hypothetical protein